MKTEVSKKVETEYDNRSLAYAHKAYTCNITSMRLGKEDGNWMLKTSTKKHSLQSNHLFTLCSCTPFHKWLLEQ